MIYWLYYMLQKYEIVSAVHHLVYNIGKQMDFIGKFPDTTGEWVIIG